MMAYSPKADHKPQIGDYFYLALGKPLIRVVEIYSERGSGWFVKGDDEARYLITFDSIECMWIVLLKVENSRSMT